MFEYQSLPTTTSGFVDSMEELFDLIEADNFYPFPEDISKVNSQPSDDDAKETLNFKEWIIQDDFACKIRPPKLCEFLRLLLSNSRYVSYASWLNENEGLFKIHQPMQIADLWGKIKGRKTTGVMDYDTFARGIRSQYKLGIMIKTYRKYTYRFAQ
jgi:hypothetical protein